MSEEPIGALAVYLSSTTARAAEMERYAEEMRAQDLIVVSRWPLEVGQMDMATAAKRDLDDLSRADAIVSFTQGRANAHQGRGGRHVELGVAIARSMRVVIVGEREHAFHHLASVTVVPDWPAALRHLVQLARAVS